MTVQRNELVLAGFVALGFCVSGAVSADLPENLAVKAKVSASSQYSDNYGARFAIDGNIPAEECRKDFQQVWCCNGAKDSQAEFVLQWEQPVDVAEIVYWGRTGMLVSECWKDYEVYLGDDAQPASKGTFRMLHGPQRIEVPKRSIQKLRLRFLTSYGGPNPGASEIAVYPQRSSDEQLAWYPLGAAEIRERIRKQDEEVAPFLRVASTIGGRVVFLSGTRPHNSVDWTTPVVKAPAETTNRVWASLGYGASDQTYRCYIEKDSPGPATMGHQLFLLDPKQIPYKPCLLFDAGNGWIGGAMSSSYDGKFIYFAMAPEKDPFFHIYRLSADGGKPEQLTFGTFQDADPDVLPDGRIVFCSTRFGSREEYHGYLVSTIFSMGPNGENIQPLTYHVVNDREPKVTASGCIVFVRQDNFFMNGKIETQIHQVHANGMNGTVILGQDREGSGYDRYTAHEKFPKAIGFLAPQTLNFKRNGNAFGCPAPLPDGRVAALCSPTLNWSPNYPFTNSAIGIVISNSSTTDGQSVDPSEKLHDISALPDGRLLCATIDKKSLGIVDLKTGKVEKFYSSSQGVIHSPLYVGRRPTPAVMTTASAAKDTGRSTGFLYCQNVFNTKQTNADTKRIKAVRILEGRPLTVRMLACNDYEGGVNHIGTEAVELGVAPLFPDGSFFVEAPADRALAFQAIDAEGRSVVNEMTWIYTRPNEHRSCVGCHAKRQNAPEMLRRKAQSLDYPPLRLVGEGVPFRYKANTLAHGGVTGSNFDRIRETKSINLYPYPAPRAEKSSAPLPPGRAGTVQALCERLQKGADAERMSAAYQLGIIRDRAAGPALQAALSDRDSRVRMNAAMALSSCGDRGCVDGLVKALRDSDLQVALAGSVALAQLTGHTEPLKDLEPAGRDICVAKWKQWLAENDWTKIEQQQIGLLANSEPDMVVMAVQTLGHIGGTPAKEALRGYASRCLDLKDKTDLQSLLDAVRGLGHLKDAESIPLVKSILATHLPLPLRERSARLAETAAEALGWIGTEEASTALIEAVPQLKRFWEYNLALGDQGGGWGDYLSCSPVHYRFLEAFDAMGTRLPEPAVFVMINSLHMSFDQPLLLEPDTYETMLARVVQRSGSLDTVLDSCFAMLDVGQTPTNEVFRSSLVEEVFTHRYPQMNGKTGEKFTIPQRVAYVLSVLGIRPEDAPRYQDAFRKYRDRYQVIRKDYRGLETGACAWICFYSLEALGRLQAADAYDIFMGALAGDPEEAIDGLPGAEEHIAHFATTPHYRVAAAFGLGQLGKHEAVPALLAAVKNFNNALEVRHAAARALVKLCDGSDVKTLRETAENYPEVVTRRVLLQACEGK